MSHTQKPMLKVFSPTESRGQADARLAKDTIRAKTLAELTDEILEAKNNAEIAFIEMMERQKKEAEEWTISTTERKQALAREVERLEQRRKNALIPPLIKAEDIHLVEEELWARKLEVDLKESENEEKTRSLMVQLDAVASREQDLTQRERRTKQMEEGAEMQKQQVASSSRLLSLRLVNFEQMASERETALAYQQSELDARVNLCKDTETSLVEREREIEAANRLLQDQRVVLDKGFEELRKLKEKQERHGTSNGRIST